MTTNYFEYGSQLGRSLFYAVSVNYLYRDRVRERVNGRVTDRVMVRVMPGFHPHVTSVP